MQSKCLYMWPKEASSKLRNDTVLELYPYRKLLIYSCTQGAVEVHPRVLKLNGGCVAEEGNKGSNSSSQLMNLLTLK